jgi:hypothetical protein
MYLLIGFAYLWMFKGIGSRVLLGSGKVLNPSNNLYFKIYPKISKEGMSYQDALKYINNLDGTWRLPTIDELVLIFELLHNKGKIDLDISSYWSSSFEGEDVITFNMNWEGEGIEKMKRKNKIRSHYPSYVIAVKDA